MRQSIGNGTANQPGYTNHARRLANFIDIAGFQSRLITRITWQSSSQAVVEWQGHRIRFWTDAITLGIRASILMSDGREVASTVFDLTDDEWRKTIQKWIDNPPPMPKPKHKK